MALWRARKRAGDPGGRIEGARVVSGCAPALHPIGLAFLSVISVAGIAGASAGFGPIAWSPDGSRLLAWNHGVVSELPLGKGERTTRTDTIPEPLALAIEWATGLLAVAPASGPPRIDFYRRSDREPFASLGGLRGEIRILEVRGSTLVAAGPGFCESRAFPDGALLDSLRWVPVWNPVDFRFTEGGRELLFRDRLIRQEGGTSFLPLPGPGDALAFAGGTGGSNGVGLLCLRDAELLLAPPGEPARLITRLAPCDRLLGIALSSSSRLVLLGIGLVEGTPSARAQPRLEVRDAASGAVVKKFRSARLLGMADREADYEEPLSAAFDPTSRYLAVGWRVFGIQVWDTESWELEATYVP